MAFCENDENDENDESDKIKSADFRIILSFKRKLKYLVYLIFSLIKSLCSFSRNPG
jgi:hypothetical protein